jgi:hypothetical protein
MRTLYAVLCTVFLFVLVPSARGELRGGWNRDEVRKMLYARIYLRTDVPTNDHVDPFIEISPTGYSWDRLVNLAEEGAKRKNKPSGVYWAFRPNDSVKWGRPTYQGNTITVWFEGERDELKVNFVQINTLDDFKKAFDFVFSPVPLQDEHTDWPAEVRSAIADRRVIEGMTKKQASCVVGTPAKIETSKEAGTDVDVWYPRQDTGYSRLPKTGLPLKLRFVNDKLTAIEK